MKRLMLTALAFLATPAFAEDWTTYDNSRFGFSVQVPATGWEAQPDPDNGDGRTWYSTDRRSVIKAWGSNVLSDFKTESAERVAAEKDKGWNITADMGWNMDLAEGLEGWHVLSASVDGRMIQQKAIVTCQGTISIFVRLENFESDFANFLPVTDTLINSLKPGPDGGCPPG